MHYLNEDGIIQKQDNGVFSITDLRALLFAKDLNEFAKLCRTAMRVVQYKGFNRLLIQKEDSFIQGYAVCFENIVRYMNALLPRYEAQHLPAPRIEVFQDSTKVARFSEMEFSNIRLI